MTLVHGAQSQFKGESWMPTAISAVSQRKSFSLSVGGFKYEVQQR
jgi:hypothetical protein